jgi:hypothetical protein
MFLKNKNEEKEEGRGKEKKEMRKVLLQRSTNM